MVDAASRSRLLNKCLGLVETLGSPTGNKGKLRQRILIPEKCKLTFI